LDHLNLHTNLLKGKFLETKYYTPCETKRTVFCHKLFIYTPGEKKGLYPIFKNWFIIDSRVLRVPLGPLSTWQLNMG
jgi:hypothetical protein